MELPRGIVLSVKLRALCVSMVILLKVSVTENANVIEHSLQLPARIFLN
jgi:hypothetical protein